MEYGVDFTHVEPHYFPTRQVEVCQVQEVQVKKSGALLEQMSS